MRRIGPLFRHGFQSSHSGISPACDRSTPIIKQMPTKRTAKPLSAKDTSKTSWSNGKARAALMSGSPSERVLALVSNRIECAVGPTGSLMEPLKEGDDYWTEAYAQANQLRVLFDSMQKLVADLLHCGVCVAIAQCGKVMVVPDFASTRNKCDDPGCGPCGEVKWARSYVGIVGTGRATIGSIDDATVNFSRFRTDKTPKPFYYPNEVK